MHRRPLVALRLVLTVQWRARFPQVYFGVAILAVVVFRTLIPAELVPLAVPAFLFGEPGSLGILMVAAHRYMERGERSVVALAMTPLTSRAYVTALILASAIVPTLAAAMIQAGVLGVDARVALVMPPLYFLAVVSGGIGLILSTVFTEFTRFILGSIPPITLYSLPLLSFFGLAPAGVFKWIPSDSAIVIFGMLAQGRLNAWTYAGSLALLALFAILVWWAAVVTYAARVRREIEFV